MAHLSYSPAIAISSFVKKIADTNVQIQTMGGDQADVREYTYNAIGRGIGITEDQVLLRLLLLMSKANAKLTDLLYDTDIIMSKEEIISSFYDISSLISPGNFSSPWRTSKEKYLTDENVSNVMTGCNIIGTFASRFSLPEVDIDDLIEKILDLKEDVIKSDIDDFVKEFVNDDLDFLICTIKNFLLIGPPGMQMAFGNLTSSLYCNDQVLNSSWAKKLGAILLVTAGILGAIADLDAVSEILSEKSKQIVELLTHQETKLLEDFSNKQ